MDLLTKSFRKMIIENQLKISMSELARVTGVSTSQLRYWERKGYITSEQDQQNKNHYFSLVTMFQVYAIKIFLDQGFTLTVAVQKEKERRQCHEIFKHFIIDRVMGISQVDGQKGEVDLGPLTDDPNKKVIAVVEPDKTSLRLRSSKETKEN